MSLRITHRKEERQVVRIPLEIFIMRLVCFQVRLLNCRKTPSALINDKSDLKTRCLYNKYEYINNYYLTGNMYSQTEPNEFYYQQLMTD